MISYWGPSGASPPRRTRDLRRSPPHPSTPAYHHNLTLPSPTTPLADGRPRKLIPHTHTPEATSLRCDTHSACARHQRPL